MYRYKALSSTKASDKTIRQYVNY